MLVFQKRLVCIIGLLFGNSPPLSKMQSMLPTSGFGISNQCRSADEGPENALIFSGGFTFYKKDHKENKNYNIVLKLCIQDLK
jgi:hypothetical protein